MKNKLRKILFIVSMIIFILGILCWFGTNDIIDENNSIISLLSIFGLVTLRLQIVTITIGLVALIWLIYDIVILCIKIKNNEIKWKNFSIVCIILILIILILTIIFSLFKTRNNERYIKTKYDYYIIYKDSANSMNIYNIYKTNNKVKVYVEELVKCIKDSCQTIKTNHEVEFSSANMKIVNDFINSFFNYSKYNSIQIFSENLNNEQYNILKSIIYNDETLLNN